jgi:hypothetical protein
VVVGSVVHTSEIQTIKPGVVDGREFEVLKKTKLLGLKFVIK